MIKDLSIQATVLIAAAMISLAILISGGVIKINKNQTDNSAAAPAANNQAAAPAAQDTKTVDQMVSKLKEYAGKLSLDQSKFDQCLDSNSKQSLVAADLSDGTSLGVNGTPSFFVNGRPLFIGASPYDQFKTVIDQELNGTAPTGTDRKTVGLGNLPAQGSQNAPVTFVEFSDYQCPFCGAFFSNTEAQIKKDYVDTGKVKFVYRDFPLSQIHPGAEKGAEAARCAGDQGKYWEYHNLVFSNQNDIF